MMIACAGAWDLGIVQIEISVILPSLKSVVLDDCVYWCLFGGLCKANKYSI